MKLITIAVKNLDRLLDVFKSKGYEVVLGPHSVLTDNSEIEEIRITRNGFLKAIIIAHYISQYYKVIIDTEGCSDNEVLEALLKAKYSSQRWRVPVNPVAILVADDEVISVIDKYSDDYPCEEASRYLRIYQEKNPGREQLFTGLLASVLEKISTSQ